MATYTTNYNLKKPDSSDPFGDFRGDYNDNLDIIDANLGGGGGSGGHTILDPNGTSLPQEDDLQFTGSVSVTDDNVNGRTVVNVSGGSNLILDAQIYSDNEKVVGVWRDKKPLYAKTYTATITSGTQWIDTGLDSGDLIVKSEGTLEQTNGQILTLASGDTGAGAGINTFIIGVVTPSKWSCLFRTNSNDARGDLTLTLYYTKGSDVAGSGGYEAYGFSPVIYSDVERVIGVWRDNKPLYQRTYHFNSLVTLNSNTWVDTGFKISDSVIVGNSVAFRDDNIAGQSFPVIASADIGTNQAIELLQTRNSSITISGFTIQYTKTTDVAGSGDYNTYEVPTVHYSTSEQVIGTWINSKPLYQKTLILRENGVDLYTYSGNSYLNCLPNDIDFIDIVQMFMPRSGGDAGYVDVRNNYNEVQVVPNISNQSINLYDNHNPTDTILTIQYTKTTDT